MNTDFLITDITRVVLVDKYEYKERFISFGNKIICNELVFHISGHSTLYYNDNAFNITPNAIRFLPEGTNTRYDVDRHEPGNCILVDFHTDKPISDDAFIIYNQYTGNFAPLFRKMFSVWIAKEEGYYFECISILYKIFAELQKTHYIPEKQYALIKPAIDYVNEHLLDTEIKMEALAELCGISYSYLKKVFIKKFGLSPKKYIIQIKMNYACELLKAKLYTVSQVAQLCGYNDVYFFSRQFKVYVGISPSGFIKKYKSSK